MIRAPAVVVPAACSCTAASAGATLAVGPAAWRAIEKSAVAHSTAVPASSIASADCRWRAPAGAPEANFPTFLDSRATAAAVVATSTTTPWAPPVWVQPQIGVLARVLVQVQPRVQVRVRVRVEPARPRSQTRGAD